MSDQSTAPTDFVFTQTLRDPIPDHKGDLTAEIGFRKPRAGDITRCGNPVKYMPHDDEQEISFDEPKMTRMLSALSGIPEAMINRMTSEDWTECAWGIARFFIPGLSRKP
jgi:hypothetical protein